ncbi:D-alanyl-D-alanine carboxypeptidase [Aureimonas ureilytica]|uniref:D-alanyl-D-alanine carboxypeptidase n=1 Tax=Aureimonas ureilytica TaxID=401562 RepID=UPI000378514C|nr:D-alanyl-D-alanine carboxypeptidase [Aureimonas ureilytica]
MTHGLSHRLQGRFAAKWIVVGLALLAMAGANAAPARAANVGSTLVLDANTGEVLLAKDADAQRFPASLTKMMTLYLVFEALETGSLTLDTRMKVSAFAASRPPTKLGVKAGTTLAVREAIPALITRSANDAAAVIAEQLGGSEARFAEMMTAKAHQLGMSQTNFANPHGLPNPNNVTTASDIAKLGLALREHFPKRYSYFQIKSFSFRGTTIPTHNNLLKRSEIYDGIKTGYTNASGFNIVTSVSSEGKRLLVVVFGGRTARSRDDYVANLVAAYLPKASTEQSGPLVAAFSPRFKGPAVRTHVASLPSDVPYPKAKPDLAASRIAQAFEDGAARTVADVSGGAASQDKVRSAILQALREEPRSRSLLASTPAMKAMAQAELQRPAHMPGTSVASLSESFDVQIAATPSEATARQLLADVQSRLKTATLGTARPDAQEMRNNGRSLFRARFTGFASKDLADEACAAIKRAAYTCYTLASTD